jgi:hypothetical protein
LVAALLVVSTAGASGCPLCYQAAQLSISDGVRLDMADRVILAAPLGADQFQIVAVVKGEGQVGETIPGNTVYGASASEREPSLLIRNPFAWQWTSLGTIPLEYSDWLRQVIATREIGGDRPPRTWPLTSETADGLSYAGWRQRVALVLPYLENGNPLAARLAWRELARAPYVSMDTARSRIDPATVVAWIDLPELTARRATYITLLGFVAGAAETTNLEQRLKVALDSHQTADVAAMIAADLELRGPSWVDWIESRYFADISRTLPEIEAALLALKVHGDANRTVPRDRVVRAFRVFIRQRPGIAGFVAPQLADWNCWDAVSDYEAIVRSNNPMDPASEFGINIYLKRAAAAGIAIQ